MKLKAIFSILFICLFILAKAQKEQLAPESIDSAYWTIQKKYI